MKYLIRIKLVVIFFVLFSCKKEQDIQLVVVPKSTPVTLSINEKINDSTLVLKWNKTNVKGFKSYNLFRIAKVYKNGVFNTVSEMLLSTTDENITTYKDDTMPLAIDITYNLSVITDSIKNNKYSFVLYKRQSAYASAKFSDMVVDKQKTKIFLIDQAGGSIKCFNYLTNKLVASASVGITVGYSALGSYNGNNNELYVPTADGWLLILDSETLLTKDRIYVGGDAIGSVIAFDNKIIVSSSDKSYGYAYNNAIKIYNRATKLVTGWTGDWNYTRLLVLEGLTNEFIDITFSISPVDLAYYKIDKNGVPLINKSDNYHGDYPLDGSLVRSFPDGNRFITGGAGTVYGKDLIYEKSLSSSYGQKYIDFAFNANGGTIYSAYRTEKKIDLVSYPSAVVNQTLATKLTPAFIFRDGNKLFCVTVENTNFKNSETIIFIEKFDI